MHLLKLRALVVPVASVKPGSFACSRRTIKYFVRQSDIAHSSRFPANDSTAKDTTTFPRQLFEKTWTLSGSKPLEKLKVHLPGVTFIICGGLEQEDGDDDQVAKIHVTSDSVDTLEGVRVESKFPYRTILDCYPSSPRNHKSASHGKLLTEILLPRGYSGGLLRSLAAIGDGLVIVEDGVLVNETIRLAATQGGRLAIRSTEDVDVNKLQIAVASRSKIYFQAPNISARHKIGIAGAGGSQVHLQSHNGFSTPLLKIAVAGSNKVRVQAPSFTVDEMKSAIAGSGRIVVAGGTLDLPASTTVPAGDCNSHSIVIFGAGNVDCADLITKRASVAVAGQGALALEVQEALALITFGEAKLAYLHAAPHLVTLKNFPAVSPLAPMSEEDCSVRKQQKETAARELKDFWSSLPSRETALGVKKC